MNGMREDMCGVEDPATPSPKWVHPCYCFKTKDHRANHRCECGHLWRVKEEDRITDE